VRLVAVNLAATVLLASGPAGARRRPVVVQIYDGFGTPLQARVWGRVLEDEGQPPPRAGDGWYRKLKRNVKALESDELPRAVVQIQVLDRKQRVVADDEGLFEVQLKGPLPQGTHAVSAQFVADRKGKQHRFRVEGGKLMVWPASGLAVISDIDDTVLRTGVGNKLKMARRVMTTSALDLETYPGAPALYRAWHRRGYPIVFVSGSPVNLYLKLSAFLAHRKFPRAPLMLKDFGLKDLTEQKAYKLGQIARVVQLLPGYCFILVGDDGEQDPTIYEEVGRRYKGKVELVLIHHVADRPVLGGQLRFSSYAEAARQLRQRKKIDDAELKQVEQER